jgi:hypothetical protein
MVKFAAIVVDTGGEFAISAVDIGFKFSTGVIDTGAVAHLDLRKSLPIFEQILNDPIVIFRGLREMIHEKNRKQKLL